MTTKGLIPEDLDLMKGSLKKTAYLDVDVYEALQNEAKNRHQKKVMPLINTLLREMLVDGGVMKTLIDRVSKYEEAQKKLEERLVALEKKSS